MTEKRRDMPDRLAQIDRHMIQPEEYDDVPEITDADFARARFERAGRPVGRPPSPSPKVPVSLRLDAKTVIAFKSTGPGWQTRMNNALAEAAGRLIQEGQPRGGRRARAASSRRKRP